LNGAAEDAEATDRKRFRSTWVISGEYVGKKDRQRVGLSIRI